MSATSAATAAPNATLASSASLWPASSTVLITGGATGIGLGLAKALISRGHRVIISGRRQDKLDEAASLVPGLLTIQNDIETDQGRQKLYDRVTRDYPDVNVLVNNAAIFADTGIVTSDSEWSQFKQIHSINTEGTIHLSYLFTKHFLTKPKALIIILTSVLAFIPIAGTLAYTMSKAALHHFSVGLRMQLKNMPIAVVEAIPGPTNTDMLPEKLKAMGATVETYVNDLVEQVSLGHEEFGLTGGVSDGIASASYEKISGMIAAFNS